MGTEKTQVETGELRAWARGTADRADRASEVADDAGNADVGLDVFGLIHRAFAGDFIDRLNDTVKGVRDTARYLAIDSNDAVAVADSFDEIEHTQADRFTGGGHD